jgi:hypothetical protein
MPTPADPRAQDMGEGWGDPSPRKRPRVQRDPHAAGSSLQHDGSALAAAGEEMEEMEEQREDEAAGAQQGGEGGEAGSGEQDGPPLRETVAQAIQAQAQRKEQIDKLVRRIGRGRGRGWTQSGSDRAAVRAVLYSPHDAPHRSRTSRQRARATSTTLKRPSWPPSKSECTVVSALISRLLPCRPHERPPPTLLLRPTPAPLLGGQPSPTGSSRLPARPSPTAPSPALPPPDPLPHQDEGGAGRHVRQPGGPVAPAVDRHAARRGAAGQRPGAREAPQHPHGVGMRGRPTLGRGVGGGASAMGGAPSPQRV